MRASAWRWSARAGFRRAGPLPVREPGNHRHAARGAGRHRVRAVEVPGDAAEASRLVLGEVTVAGTLGGC